MKPIAFHHLCHILTEGEHIRLTTHMSITEQVLIFFHIIGHNVRFRVIGSRIHRSTETVHRYFNVVLRGLKEFSDRLLENGQELFNLQHSSLRTTIKRGFGVLKKHFRVLDVETFSSVGCRTILGSGSQQETQSRRESVEDSRVWNAKRDEICKAMWSDYTRIMSKGKEKVGSKQFRWLPPMHTTMLTVLAKEATKGNKPSNTFKPGSFATVAKAITEQFGVECHPSYVENRMRTLRTMWTTIQTLRKKSGFGWDDSLKMITCDAKTYQEEVMAHCKHADFLNKKIEIYDELAIVVGKDLATGSFVRSYVDIDTEHDNAESTEMVADNGEEGVADKGKNVVESSTTRSTLSKSHKRGRAPPSDDSALTDLSDQLKEIAVALKEINRGPIDFNSLYSEVMAMVADGYSEDMLATAFDHLCKNKK
ncbi:hypothetical protein ACB092_02G259100, partial [Castanea dentata]